VKRGEISEARGNKKIWRQRGATKAEKKEHEKF